MRYYDNNQLHWIWQNRQRSRNCRKVGDAVSDFVKKWIRPRHKKLAALAGAWQALLPPELVEHSCLESLQRGQLRVLVDSAGHLAELSMLVRGGLAEQLRAHCPSAGLSQIKLVRGTWQRLNEEGLPVPTFP